MILNKLINENKLVVILLLTFQIVITMFLVVFSSFFLTSSKEVYETFLLDDTYKATAMLTDTLTETNIESILSLLEEYKTLSYMEGNVIENSGTVFSTRLIYDSENTNQYYYSYEDLGDLPTSIGIINEQFTHQDKYHYSSLIYMDDSIIAFFLNKENLYSLLYSEHGRNHGINEYLNNLVILNEDPLKIKELEYSLNEISNDLIIIIEEHRIKGSSVESFYISTIIVVLFVILLIIFTIHMNIYLPFLITNNQFINVYFIYEPFNLKVKLSILLFIAIILLTPSILVFLFLYYFIGFDQTLLLGFLIFLFFSLCSSLLVAKKVFLSFQKGRMIDE